MSSSLILSHKRKLRIWGDMMSVSGMQEVERSGGGKRGDVEVFSAGSRYRLFRLLHQLTFESVCFMTLTYPDQFPTSPSVYKAELKEFHRRFEVEYPAVQCVWRLEFQKRGAPHYHLMLLDWVPDDDGVVEWIWKCTCHTWDMAHELLGVNYELIVDSSQQRLVAHYLAKYIAKVDQTEIKHDTRKCGRWWGKWNIADPEPVEFEVSDWEAERIVTIAIDSRMGDQRWKPIDPTICTVFGDSMGSGLFGEFIRRYKDILRNGKR